MNQPYGKPDDQRVAIWTECQRMDMLAPNLAFPGLEIAARKRCLQSGNHDLLGSSWFVATGVLCTEMVM
jgi:hypothetical protein